MTHPPYLRENARKLRIKNKMSLDEIAECLALGRTIVWYWIRDLPDAEINFQRTPERRAAQLRGQAAAAKSNRDRAAAKRERAYLDGWADFEWLIDEPGFRDFVCMYIGEGYKRNRNRVAIGNSDPRVVALGDHWIRRFARNPVAYALQYHADQDPEHLRRFWCGYLGVEDPRFRLQRKSNSNQLDGRKWRSRYGVLTVGANDTWLRARLQAWMDRVQDSWLDSASPGV